MHDQTDIHIHKKKKTSFQIIITILTVILLILYAIEFYHVYSFFNEGITIISFRRRYLKKLSNIVTSSC